MAVALLAVKLMGHSSTPVPPELEKRKIDNLLNSSASISSSGYENLTWNVWRLLPTNFWAESFLAYAIALV